MRPPGLYTQIPHRLNAIFTRRAALTTATLATLTPTLLGARMPCNDPIDAYEQNKTDLTESKGGELGIGNVGAGCLRWDHNAALKHVARMLAYHKETGIPFGWAHFDRQRELAREDNSMPWGDVDDVSRQLGGESMGHGSSHLDRETSAGYDREIVRSLPNLERHLPSGRIQCMTLPGVGGTYMGRAFRGETMADFRSEAGQMMLDTYGSVEGRLSEPGDVLHPLNGRVGLGLRRFDIEQLDFYQIRDKIQEAQAERAGLMMMLHPSRVGSGGPFLSEDHYGRALRWMASERDAGRYMPLSPSGLAVADTSHTRRLDLVSNGQFEDGPDVYTRDHWTYDGPWRMRYGMMSIRDHDNGTLRQTVDVPPAVRGTVFTLTVHAEVTGASNVETRMYINGGDIDRRFNVAHASNGTTKIIISQILDRRLSEYRLGIDVPDPGNGTLSVKRVQLQAA